MLINFPRGATYAGCIFVSLYLSSFYLISLASRVISSQAGMKAIQMGLALESIHIMTHDPGLRSNLTVLNLVGVCKIFDEGLQSLGLHGMLSTLNTLSFGQALAFGLNQINDTRIQVRISVNPHAGVLYFNNAADVQAVNMSCFSEHVPASLYWLWHYFGIYLGSHIQTVAEFHSMLELLHHQQLKADASFVTVAAYHGLIWHTIGNLKTDIQIHTATMICINMSSMLYQPILWTSLKRECAHAVGHGLYLNFIQNELGMKFTPCEQPHFCSLPAHLKPTAAVYTKCTDIFSVDSQLSASCTGGVYHFWEIFGKSDICRITERRSQPCRTTAGLDAIEYGLEPYVEYAEWSSRVLQISSQAQKMCGESAYCQNPESFVYSLSRERCPSSPSTM